MKTIQFIYQDTEIHFALQSKGSVMVNATEMAKMFSKETRVFLKTAHAKAFITALESEIKFIPNGKNSTNEQAPNGARSDFKIVDNRGHMGIYFERRLALKFAAWLDVTFELWVFSTIDKLLFGHYKEHWDAHQLQINAESKIKELKPKLLKAPTPKLVFQYFEAEQVIKNAKNLKRKAITNQYKIHFT